MKEKLGGMVRRLQDYPGGRNILRVLASTYSIYSRGAYTPIYYRHGLWVHRLPDGFLVDRMVSFSMTLSHYRKESDDYWCFLYKPRYGDIIVDIGAGLGAEAGFFSPIIGSTGRMISVEAHPDTYSGLDLFCRLNKLKNVTRLQIAVHHSNEPVFIDNPASHVGSSIVGQVSGYKVDGATIDHIVEDNKLTCVNFLKMNIEGAELYALEGMRNALSITRYICVACHDFKADRNADESLRTKEKVKSFLASSGFSVFDREEDSRPWVRDIVYAENRSFR